MNWQSRMQRTRKLSQWIAKVKGFRDTHPGINQIAENVSWLFADNVLRLMVLLTVNAQVVRYLGPERYGDLSFAQAFVALFIPLAALGLNNIVVRELVKYPENEPEILGSAFALMFAGSICASLLAMGTIWLVRPGDTRAHILVIIISGSMLFQAFNVFDGWFQSQVQSKYTVYARNFTLICTSVLKLVAAFVKAPLSIFAGLLTLESGLFALSLIFVYRSKRFGSKTPIGWGFSAKWARQLLRDSWPLLLEGMAIMVYMRIDQTLLGQILPAGERSRTVGLYAAAVRVSEIGFFIPGAITSSLFPAIIKSRTLDPAIYQRRIQGLFNLITLIAYGMAIPLTLFSPIIVRVLYGAEYAAAAPMLAILTWAGVWVATGLVRNAVLQSENRQIITLKTGLIGAVSNIVLNIVLIPVMGGSGSALATVISYGLAAYVSSFMFQPLRMLGKMQTRALLFPNPFEVLRHES